MLALCQSGALMEIKPYRLVAQRSVASPGYTIQETYSAFCSFNNEW